MWGPKPHYVMGQLRSDVEVGVKKDVCEIEDGDYVCYVGLMTEKYIWCKFNDGVLSAIGNGCSLIPGRL